MPRDPERIPEVLAALQDAWELNPDQRFFQLLYNVLQTTDSLADLYYIEDWQLAQNFEEYIQRHNS